MSAGLLQHFGGAPPWALSRRRAAQWDCQMLHHCRMRCLCTGKAFVFASCRVLRETRQKHFFQVLTAKFKAHFPLTGSHTEDIFREGGKYGQTGPDYAGSTLAIWSVPSQEQAL
eukprot:984637-Pelagomonas_calceolata.AAC.1